MNNAFAEYEHKLKEIVELVQDLVDSSNSKNCPDGLVLVSKSKLYDLEDFVVNFLGDD